MGATAFNTASIYPVQLLGVDGHFPAAVDNPLPVSLGTGSITATISGVVLGNSTASIGNVTAVISGTALVSGVVAIDQANFGTSNRVVAGKTQSVSITAAMTTTTAYTLNQVVGGLLTFPNTFGTSGSGVLQTVDVNMKSVQTGTWLFTPFHGNPSNSTWTDHSIAAIATSDVFSARDPIGISGGSNALGTATVYSAPGLGIAMAPGSTTLYGILQSSGTSAAFNTTSDIQVTVKVLQD